jgi:hypothetical protein
VVDDLFLSNGSKDVLFVGAISTVGAAVATLTREGEAPVGGGWRGNPAPSGGISIPAIGLAKVSRFTTLQNLQPCFEPHPQASHIDMTKICNS